VDQLARDCHIFREGRQEMKREEKSIKKRIHFRVYLGSKFILLSFSCVHVLVFKLKVNVNMELNYSYYIIIQASF